MPQNTKEAAFRRWRQILPALGISEQLLRRKAQPCPMCGGVDRFVFDDKHGNGDYFCRQCGPGNGFDLLRKIFGWDFAHTATEVDRVLGTGLPQKTYIARQKMTWEEVAQIWRTAKPILIDSPVDVYLRGRGISMGLHPKALRFVDHWKHTPTLKFLPCMMALFRDADGAICNIHRTYLADVTPNKMFLPTRVPAGGAIRLSEPAIEMGIAEGIETALSASLLFNLPVWATTSERLLREWRPPVGARRITIFADHDHNYVGQSAAYDLAKRLVLRHGFDVKIKIPDMTGWDFNDVIKNEIATERYGMPELRMEHGDIQSGSQPISDS